MTSNKPLKCKKCGSTALIKYGFKTTVKGKLQRYQCKQCAHIQTV